MKQIGKKVMNNIQYKDMPTRCKWLGRRNKAMLISVSVADVFERIASRSGPFTHVKNVRNRCQTGSRTIMNMIL
jgi:hypothetical protein